MQMQNKVKCFIWAQMQPDKCNAQHAAEQCLEQSRLKELMSGTKRSQPARREIFFRETFLHKGKLKRGAPAAPHFY